MGRRLRERQKSQESDERASIFALFLWAAGKDKKEEERQSVLDNVGYFSANPLQGTKE